MTSAYGLTLRWVEEDSAATFQASELPLFRLPAPLDSTRIDWLRGIDTETPWFGRSGSDYAYRFENIADFLVEEDGRSVRVWRDPSASDALFEFVLLRGVTPRVLHLRGIPCLHASAVEIAGGAVAFAGGSGSGKSTVAAFLCSAGFPFISDDVVPIRRASGSGAILAGPGLPEIRLHPDARQFCSLPVAPPGPGQTKGICIPPRTVAAPLPLRCIYLLGERPAAAADTLMALVRSSFWIDPARTGALGNDFQYWAEIATTVPIRPLSFDFSTEGLKFVQSQVADS